MRQLKTELKRLDREEAIETARLKLTNKRIHINKLRQQNKSPMHPVLKWLTDSPDYLGTQKGNTNHNKTKKIPRHSINEDNFGFGFKF